MTRRRLLDLFCGAGGAAMGYHRAGFEDLLRGGDVPGLARFWSIDDFDAIHASPPCQAFSEMTRTSGRTGHPDLLTPTRELLEQVRIPWVIENVPFAPMRADVLRCGSMFDMDIKRHRLFETNWPIRPHMWPCRHKIWSARFPPEHLGMKRRGRLSRVVGVYGGGRYAGSDALRRQVMEIDWMSRDELSNAVPPRYTQFIGEQLWALVEAGRTA